MKCIVCVFLFYLAVVMTTDEWREVKIVQGTLRGRKHPENDVFVFYGVPYATTPVGVNKFKAPLPPPQWSEPYDAIDENIACPQHGLLGEYNYQSFRIEEDCLIANIYVPDTNKKNLSVVVYVHGGGFVLGFGNMIKPLHLLEKKDIIAVTFNYRLGIHGFLCLGTEDAPGNAGMKDQVALLRWVQKNIASFGGNPDDVTLVGNSAGSASVDLLMLSKAAEGLFHRAVPESGGNLAAFTIQSDPVEDAKAFLRQVNYTKVDNICDIEESYKTAPLELLISDAFFERTDSTFLFSPCVERDTEGAFLTEAPLSILKKGNYKKLPLLYGFANMEGLFRIDFFDSWKNKMNENFSDFLTPDLKFQSESERKQVANAIKKFYFGEKPVDNDSTIAFVNYFSDVLFTHPILWAAKYYVEGGNKEVYLYEYSFVDEDSLLVPHTNIRGASHCAQTAAVVDDEDESKLSQKYQDMKKTMREIWYNFIKTGKPVPEGSLLPAWPAAGPDRSPYMKLNEKLELGGILLEERTRFWDDIYEKYYREPEVLPASPKC